MKEKMTGNRGETLVESLSSILLIALATAMFLSFIMGAAKVIGKAKERETKVYEATAFLEGMEEELRNEESEKENKVGIGTLTVSIESANGRKGGREQFPVKVYYSNGMTSYKWESDRYLLEDQAP